MSIASVIITSPGLGAVGGLWSHVDGHGLCCCCGPCRSQCSGLDLGSKVPA